MSTELAKLIKKIDYKRYSDNSGYVDGLEPGEAYAVFPAKTFDRILALMDEQPPAQEWKVGMWARHKFGAVFEVEWVDFERAVIGGDCAGNPCEFSISQCEVYDQAQPPEWKPKAGDKFRYKDPNSGQLSQVFECSMFNFSTLSIRRVGSDREFPIEYCIYVPPTLNPEWKPQVGDTATHPKEKYPFPVTHVRTTSGKLFIDSTFCRSYPADECRPVPPPEEKFQGEHWKEMEKRATQDFDYTANCIMDLRREWKELQKRKE